MATSKSDALWRARAAVVAIKSFCDEERWNHESFRAALALLNPLDKLLRVDDFDVFNDLIPALSLVLRQLDLEQHVETGLIDDTTCLILTLQCVVKKWAELVTGSASSLNDILNTMRNLVRTASETMGQCQSMSREGVRRLSGALSPLAEVMRTVIHAFKALADGLPVIEISKASDLINMPKLAFVVRDLILYRLNLETALPLATVIIDNTLVGYRVNTALVAATIQTVREAHPRRFEWCCAAVEVLRVFYELELKTSPLPWTADQVVDIMCVAFPHEPVKCVNMWREFASSIHGTLDIRSAQRVLSLPFAPLRAGLSGAALNDLLASCFKTLVGSPLLMAHLGGDSTTFFDALSVLGVQSVRGEDATALWLLYNDTTAREWLKHARPRSAHSTWLFQVAVEALLNSISSNNKVPVTPFSCTNAAFVESLLALLQNEDVMTSVGSLDFLRERNEFWEAIRSAIELCGSMWKETRNFCQLLGVLISYDASLCDQMIKFQVFDAMFALLQRLMNTKATTDPADMICTNDEIFLLLSAVVLHRPKAAKRLVSDMHCFADMLGELRHPSCKEREESKEAHHAYFVVLMMYTFPEVQRSVLLTERWQRVRRCLLSQSHRLLLVHRCENAANADHIDCTCGAEPGTLCKVDAMVVDLLISTLSMLTDVDQHWPSMMSGDTLFFIARVAKAVVRIRLSRLAPIARDVLNHLAKYKVYV